MSFFKRIFSGKQKESLDSGLEKSRSNVFQKLSKVFTGRRRVDEDLMDELEEALITADVGVDTTMKILDRLRKRARFEAYAEVEELYTMLREEIGGLFTEDAQGASAVNEPAPGQPRIIMVVGVNGVGKSTNLAKICFWLIENKFSVLIAACDTFRAGAVEQLRTHTKRLNSLHPAEQNKGRQMVQLYEKGYGKDAAGIAMEAINYARDSHIDVVLVDTAGRMQDNEPLMRALAKLITGL